LKHARPDYDRIQDPAGLIPEDEPVFLIRGQDMAAIEAIKAWIFFAHRFGASDEILSAAAEHCKRIEDWQESIGRIKIPDLPS